MFTSGLRVRPARVEELVLTESKEVNSALFNERHLPGVSCVSTFSKHFH